MKIEDKRFLDTNSTATTFYLGLFNMDGYDRYSGTVFQDMMYRMTAEQSILNNDKPIEYFEGIVQKKGLNVVYQLNGIYRSEPSLRKVEAVTDSSVALVKDVPIEKSTEKIDNEVLLGISVPLTKEEFLATDKSNVLVKETEQKLDDRLIIIACFREDYFQEFMLNTFENELSDIDYYRAKGWVRVYLTDFPGYRIFEAKEVFPDAWRAYYGE